MLEICLKQKSILQPPVDDEEIPQVKHNLDDHPEHDEIHPLSRTEIFDTLKLRLQDEEKLAESIFKFLISGKSEAALALAKQNQKSI